MLDLETEAGKGSLLQRGQGHVDPVHGGERVEQVAGSEDSGVHVSAVVGQDRMNQLLPDGFPLVVGDQTQGQRQDAGGLAAAAVAAPVGRGRRSGGRRRQWPPPAWRSG